MFKNFVYETKNNFVNFPIYPKDMPILMNNDIWKKIIMVNRELKKNGLCLTIYDAYRPIQVQKLFWEFFYEKYGYYDELKVANPKERGTHNIKINAVDILLSNMDGIVASLPCDFDDFSKKSNVEYNGCGRKEKYNRDLLISVASKYGLIVNPGEWWHYTDESIQDYGLHYDYNNTDLVPLEEKITFLLK